MLVLCDEHIRRRNVQFHSHLRWTSLRHDTFGGVTLFWGLVGSNIPGFEPIRTTLRCTIRHVLEYSLKPKWASPPGIGTAKTLSPDNRLHPDDLLREVLYHSHYSATGWGSRSLSADKIGIAFGWPAWAQRCSSTCLATIPRVPIQVMDGCLRGITSDTPCADPLCTPGMAPLPSSQDTSWLPGIQKFLPHTWVDSELVTDKAAKQDNAGVPTHLWDLGCTLVFPHAGPALPIFRQWLMRIATANMWEEFMLFLIDTHGSNRRANLESYKTAAQRRFQQGSRKRTRGGRKRRQRRRDYRLAS